MKTESDYKDVYMKAAEAILRPYLTTPAVYGITPESKFNSIDMLPMRLASIIADALERAQGPQEKEINIKKLRILASTMAADAINFRGYTFSTDAVSSMAHIIYECLGMNSSNTCSEAKPDESLEHRLIE